jgi:hypothetical protein
VGVEVAAAVGDDEVVVEKMGERRGFEPAPSYRVGALR